EPDHRVGGHLGALACRRMLASSLVTPQTPESTTRCPMGPLADDNILGARPRWTKVQWGGDFRTAHALFRIVATTSRRLWLARVAPARIARSLKRKSACRREPVVFAPLKPALNLGRHRRALTRADSAQPCGTASQRRSRSARGDSNGRGECRATRGLRRSRSP